MPELAGEPPAGAQEERPEQCAVGARRVGEMLAGTAATATGWLAVEQPGPWGRDAATMSGLDPALGAYLAQAAQERGMRLLLIRRPDRRGFDEPDGRRVLLAHTGPGAAWVESFKVGDDDELRHLDLDGPAAGQPPGRGEQVGPVALVCTNAKRDQCCAVLGRALLRDVAQVRTTAQLWECSHLGGHRFAPTALVLPYGYTYGWLTHDLLDDALNAAAAGRVELRGLRGRSTWTASGQIAELAVRREIGDDDPDALFVAEQPDGPVLVTHRDGRRWLVEVARVSTGQQRPESCGAALKLVSGLVVERVVPVG